MPIRALPSSPAYMFSAWPAAPPVFEGISRATRLLIPIPASAGATMSPLPSMELQDPASPIVGSTAGAAASLAPARGRCLGIRPATLTNAQTVAGADFEVHGDIDPFWTPFDDHSLLAAIDRTEPAQLVPWLERIAAAGIWANRTTCPDLIAQLQQSIRRPIDTIVCTLLDTDPSACLNAALAGWYGLELCAGLLLLSRLTRARAICAVDGAAPAGWFEGVRQACRGSMRIEPLINDYPQSDPTLMLYALLGRRLRPMRLPVEQGVVYLDGPAAIAIGRCALDGSVMLSQPLVVRDHVLKQSFFIFAPMGMRIAELLEQISISPACNALRSGDVLRDIRLPVDAVVGGAELVLHAMAAEPSIQPDPCVRCGWCIDACPTRLHPAGVLEAAQLENLALAQSFGIDSCIECGVCSYVCPSKLPLLHGIRRIRALNPSTDTV